MKEGLPGRFGRLVADGELKKELAPDGVDGPRHEQCFVPSFSLRGFKGGVAEEVLDGHIRKVTIEECKVIGGELPDHFVNSGRRDKGDAIYVLEGMPAAAWRKGSPVRLEDDPIEQAGLIVETAHETGTIGLPNVSYLGDVDFDHALVGMKTNRLVTVSRPPLLCGPPSVAATTSQEVGLFGFQELLNEGAGRSFDEFGDDVLITSDTVREQSDEVPSRMLRRWRPSQTSRSRAHS